jgi:hypothetical protein
MRKCFGSIAQSINRGVAALGSGRAAICIRLLALAYPAIAKSRPKNASILIHAAGFWSKVRLPNFFFAWRNSPG